MSKIKAPPASETLAASAIISRQMSDMWVKKWYEILTNFPQYAKRIVWKFELQENGDVFTNILQNGDKVSMDTVAGNMTGNSSDLSINTINERENGGSMFGMGTGEIFHHTTDYKLWARTEGDEWDVLDRGTGDVTKVTFIEDKLNMFKQSFNFSSGNALVTEKIKTLRLMIGLFDSRAIRNGYEHIFEVSGFSDEVNKELSKPIEAFTLQWNNTDSSGVPKPQHLSLFDKDKSVIDSVKITSPTAVDGITKSIQFDIKSLGKVITERNSMFWDLGDIKDQPWCFIYQKDGRQQLLGRVPLRSLSGRENLNHVMMEVEVDKNDVRPFYTETDKFEGFGKIFKDSILKTLQPIIENTYKVDGSKERCKQLFVSDIIVNDRFGDHIYEDSANDIRSSIGASFLNGLSVEERADLVVMEEWNGKATRMDIVIRYPKDLSGKSEDTYIVIEMKKDDFNLKDIKQLFLYDYKTRGCTHIWGVSCGITEKNHETFRTWKSDVNKNGQRRLNDIKGGLIDLDKGHYRWASVSDYYQNIVDMELEKLKKK